MRMLARPAFCGTVKHEDPAGVPPAKRDEKVAPQPKPTNRVTVTGKHKKWLSDFTSKVEADKKAAADQATKAERSRKVLADKAAATRDVIRRVNEADVSEEERSAMLLEAFGGGGSKAAGATVSAGGEEDSDGENVASLSSTAKASEASSSSSSSSSSAAAAAGSAAAAAPTPRKWVRRKRADKPAWALTEEEGEEAAEEEAANLIAFADALNYDSILEDLEVREALRFAATRVGKIKREKAEEARRAAALAAGEIGADDDEFEWVEVDEEGHTAKEAAILKHNPTLKAAVAKGGKADSAAHHEAGWNSSTKVSAGGAGARAATPVVDALKTAKPDLAAIHSDASLRTLVDRAATTSSSSSSSSSADLATTVKATQSKAVAVGAGVGSSAKQREQQQEGPEVFPPPRIVTISPKDGGIGREAQPLHSTLRLSNLPYLYRNPSI